MQMQGIVHAAGDVLEMEVIGFQLLVLEEIANLVISFDHEYISIQHF